MFLLFELCQFIKNGRVVMRDKTGRLFRLEREGERRFEVQAIRRFKIINIEVEQLPVVNRILLYYVDCRELFIVLDFINQNVDKSTLSYDVFLIFRLHKI